MSERRTASRLPYLWSNVAAPVAPTPSLQAACRRDRRARRCSPEPAPDRRRSARGLRQDRSAPVHPLGRGKGRWCDRGELKGVTVPAPNEDSATAFFLRLRRRGKKIIRLEARRLRILKSASSDEFWDPVQLLKQRLVEIASTLVGGKFLMPVGRDVVSVLINLCGTHPPEGRINKAPPGLGFPARDHLTFAGLG